MSVVLSPVGNGITFLTSAGVVLSGGKINTYAAGSSTPTATYTSSSGSVPNANPIILGSNGVAPNEIWLTVGQAYKFVITDSGNNVLMTLDNLSGINDFSSLQVAGSEWVSGATPTYISTTSFSVIGNQTASYHPGRRVLTVNTGGTFYGTILTSVFTSLTTVTLQMDSGNLDSGLSAVSLGITSYTNSSDPFSPQASASIASASTVNLDNLYAFTVAVITGTTTITAVTMAQGKSKTLYVQSAGLTVQNGASLLTQTGRNIVCAAGDRLTFVGVNSKIYVTVSRLLYPQVTASGSSYNSSTGKLTINSKSFDDGSCFDAVTNYRFTPTVPGRYMVAITTAVGSSTGSTGSVLLIISKNGGAYVPGSNPLYAANQNLTSLSVAYAVDMNGTTDYIEGFISSGLLPNLTVGNTSFSAYKIDP